ncbi:uncharacterized protein LOC108632826 isoform X1 [Ceratina calcarata]|uniref:Uncharacterized protein LOC108632826 isoform X1 n=1 Tax=Ceratina calcarata TaxID=156304 RepID=A0AAJ7JGR0_9HYME|nr:uncharacterized protein LOC108632826 isoform X1 [Ceratina calcarata]
MILKALLPLYKPRRGTDRSSWCKMFLLKDLLLLSCLTVLTASGAPKTIAGAPWASYASKSAYARALGPPVTGMDTITVPYMPKSPFFPKFVDPKTMISKKTDMLSNIFGGLGPVYPMSFKPFMPIAGPPMYGSPDETNFLSNLKATANNEDVAYKRGIFGPFGGKPFGPMSPKFGPMSQFSGANAIPDYSMKDEYTRRRRSVEESPAEKLRAIMDNGLATKNLGPPPPYPTLAPISEEPEEDMLAKKMGGPIAPKQYLPGMFGPFGPLGPFRPMGPVGPVVDPSMFIAKKTAFLDNLFKTLATSTTPSPMAMDAPTAKSTIVPSDFWLPSSVIPGPTEYTEKVGEFLDKLFDSLKLNKTTADTGADASSVKYDFARSVTPDTDAQAKIVRSVDDLSSINAAKDSIVDSILSELGDLKSSMVTTMNDLITYEKSAAMMPKKPFKPFAAGPWSKTTSDGSLPFQQKMGVLSQVFDMLTDLQKNITVAMQNIIKAKMAPGPSDTNYPTSNDMFNVTLLDAIKRKLDSLDYGVPISYNPSYDKYGASMARMAPKAPGSFWVTYPENGGAKREVDTGASLTNGEESEFNQKPQTRSVKMQMHQGYQSLPAGSIESVQAGGGSTPGHQGGGIKLLDTENYEDYNDWANWIGYLKNGYQGHRHHNHH